MAVTASMVKELREKSGAGMMDCKKALSATDGNMEEAIKFLRENGLVKAEKKAGRVAAEGMVAVKVNEDGKSAAIVEVNSETDFVAKNDKFQNYVADVAAQVAASSANTVEELLSEQWINDSSKTVKEELVSMIAVIGENMTIRRFAKTSASEGFVESYIHAGGRIGVLVEMATDVINDSVKEAAKNIAMQVAAIAPKYVSSNDVSEEYKAQEREVLKAAAMNENPGKPENIIEKMIEGRLKKELKEVCLLEQAYVKDGDLTVQKYIDSVAKENNAKITVNSFVRFETGEGIEKVESNFAEEVAKQMNA